MEVVDWKKEGPIESIIALKQNDLLLTVSVYMTVHATIGDWVTLRHGAGDVDPTSLAILRDELKELSKQDRVVRIEVDIESRPSSPKTVALVFDPGAGDRDKFKFNVPAGGNLITGFRVNLID